MQVSGLLVCDFGFELPAAQLRFEKKRETSFPWYSYDMATQIYPSFLQGPSGKCTKYALMSMVLEVLSLTHLGSKDHKKHRSFQYFFKTSSVWYLDDVAWQFQLCL